MRTTLPSGVPVEIAHPDREPAAALVIAPDIMGLRPLFDDMAARLAAEQGWAVAAVEPFPGREDLELGARMDAVGGLVDAEAVGALVEAADLLGCERTGILGFCMGGMQAMKAATSPRFAAAVAFYGMVRNPEQWRTATNADALDVLRATPGAAGKLLGIFGTADPYTPEADIADLEAAGAAVVRYEGAEHGFVHDPSRPAHRPDDAADAWARAMAHLTA